MANGTEDQGRTRYVIGWRDAFKVDIPQIDQEHHRLFDLVAALDIRDMKKTVDELVDYVVTHFSNEQELMERSGYPDFGAHLKLHEGFGAYIADFLGDGESWTESKVQELRRFLNKWLVGHILTHDRRFSRWYAEHHGANAPMVQATMHKRGLLARFFGAG